MTTLFDIGDKIKLTLTGTIHSFSMTENGGDCYILDLDVKSNDIVRVYLDSRSLLAGNAEKIG